MKFKWQIDPRCPLWKYELIVLQPKFFCNDQQFWNFVFNNLSHSTVLYGLYGNWCQQFFDIILKIRLSFDLQFQHDGWWPSYNFILNRLTESAVWSMLFKVVRVHRLFFLCQFDYKIDFNLQIHYETISKIVLLTQWSKMSSNLWSLGVFCVQKFLTWVT